MSLPRLLSRCRLTAISNALAAQVSGYTRTRQLTACGILQSTSDYHTGLYQRQSGLKFSIPFLWNCGDCHGCRCTSTNAELLETVNAEVESQQQNKTFGVIHMSGRQFKITANDLIVVNRIQADVGTNIHLDKVLLAGTDNFTLVGQPLLSKEVVRVKATVVEHNKTAKVIVFKKKRRKNYKRKKGHRQPISVLRINGIELYPTLE